MRNTKNLGMYTNCWNRTRNLYILSFEVEYSGFSFTYLPHFIVQTDNSSLTYLQNHEFNIQHWPGKINAWAETQTETVTEID